MQDPNSEFPMMMKQQPPPSFPEQEHLKCPRCHSSNTKFCYYNNYNLSQPRFFCKDCRRYWTKGGALRNIPVGGGTRKNAKRRANPDPTPDSPRLSRRISEPTTSPPSSSSSTPAAGADQDPTRVYGLEADQGRIGIGSFSSLLATNSEFDGVSASGSESDLKMVQVVGGGFGEDLNSGVGMGLESEVGERGSGNESGGVGEWGRSDDGWPDLAIYTPRSRFH